MTESLGGMHNYSHYRLSIDHPIVSLLDYDDGNKRLSTDQIRELQLRTKLVR